MNRADGAAYAEKIEAEGRFWDREFLGEAPAFACFFHHAPYFKERLTRPYLRKIVGLVGPGRAALDLGCGMGWLSVLLAKAGAATRGVDVATRCIELARGRAAELGLAGLSFDRFDASGEELPEGAYDLVVSWGALHHLADVEHAAAQVARSLKPGGRFALVECADQPGFRGRLARALADCLHMALPTDRSYAQKLRHALAKLAHGKQEFEWSPFENVGGGKWEEAVRARFDVVESERIMCFLSPFAARIRMPEPLLGWTLSALFALDRALIRLRILPAEYHFMILKAKS